MRNEASSQIDNSLNPVQALKGLRVCDLSGQLAGAGSTRTLAAFGAEVIRIEDPVRQGRWDLLRGIPPFIDSRRGIELGGAFNNHNVGKLGVTLNTRTARGKELLAELIAVSDVVTENFSAGVMESWGFTYERMKEIRPDVIYVSNCGFGHSGPYRTFRTWGPIVQAVCGLTWSVGQGGERSGGFGYSYMDHHGANFMTFAILSALHHRDQTGEGQWIDMSAVEAGASMLGPDVLDWSINGTPSRRAGRPNSNAGHSPAMSPHGIYPCRGDDEWVSIACRSDADWQILCTQIDEPWAKEEHWVALSHRMERASELDALLSTWTSSRAKFDVEAQLLTSGIPAAAVTKPPERIDRDESTRAWGLFPETQHREIGKVRVDGIPVHLSETDWHIEAGAPTLGQHNREVLCGLLGVTEAEFAELAASNVI